MTTSTKSSVRRTVIALTIGSFSIAALLGVFALLGGGSFGESEARVLVTTLIVGCASIATLCYLGTFETVFAWVGGLGGIVALVAAGTSLGMLWADWGEGRGDGVLQTFGVSTVVAVALAQICLLLSLTASRHHLAWLLRSTVLLVVVAATVICAMILAEDVGSGVLRLLGVVLILDVLGTVVTIALSVFGSVPAAPGRRTAQQVVAVQLTSSLALQLRGAADATGRSPEEVAAEAVARFLGTPAGHA